MKKNQKILVTGGAGFIGSNTVRLLCDEGYDVTVFDNLSWGYRELVDQRARFINGDLLDKKAIQNALEGINKVFHFAATSIIKVSVAEPVACFHNNTQGIINLLEGMVKQKVKYIVNSSTAAVYGEPKSIPVNESDPKNPMHSYGASKLAVEYILSVYEKQSGINCTSLRYFNAYGPSDEQVPRSRAVPIWILATLNNTTIPLYWGGMQFRDYVYVEDIARAHLAVMNLKGNNVYNIGSGDGVLMKDLLERIFEIAGKRAVVVDLGQRMGDPNRLVADITKISKEVGWKPKIRLDLGLERTYEYYKNKYNPKQ